LRNGACCADAAVGDHAPHPLPPASRASRFRSRIVKPAPNRKAKVAHAFCSTKIRRETLKEIRR
jgi:hypothetical protein